MSNSDPSRKRRERVRLVSAETEVSPAGRCEARVRLEWTGGEVFEGSSIGNDTTEGRVRAGSRATVQAMQQVTSDALLLELRGTKVVRAFDRHLVIASLRGRSVESRYDLIGSATAPDGDLVRGGILAILDATNRILEKYAPRSSTERSSTPR